MFEFIGVAVVLVGSYIAYKKGYFTALINKFKKAPVVTAPAPVHVPAPAPAPSPAPVAAANDNDANGFYVDAAVTHPNFKGYGISLITEAAKFDPASHQALCVVFNCQQIDAQLQLKAGGMDITVTNTCYQNDRTNTAIPNTIRCPPSVKGRDNAAKYINALPVINVIH